MSRREIELEITVFSQFRDSAVEAGLQSAALKLAEEISARKQALGKIASSHSPARGSKAEGGNEQA
jgi:hypothetical protein